MLMPRATCPTWTLAVLVLAVSPTAGQQTGKKAEKAPSTHIIGTHQIDRYEAIQRLRTGLQANPNNLHDWIILGELAQEVAADVPGNIAAGYYRLARESYEAAERLAPKDAHLKAAAQFAREQEQAAERFADARRKATTAYLAARRRELARPGAAPTVRVYSAPGNRASAPAQPYYYYRPYVAQPGTPYTYQQYSQAYFETPVQAETDGVNPRDGEAMTATERAALVKPAAEFAPP
jgi:hypothetical protein